MTDKIEQVKKIIDKLFEIIEHGDFSNGNAAQGLDEGQCLVQRMVTELKQEYNTLYHQEQVICPVCDCSGIDVGIETIGCSVCNGTGKVPSTPDGEVPGDAGYKVSDFTNNQEFCPQHGYPLPCAKCGYQPTPASEEKE